MIRILKTKDRGFKATLRGILNRGNIEESGVYESVESIIDDVKKRGDKALSELTLKFDGVRLKDGFEVGRRRLKEALGNIPKKDLELLRFSRERIENFHSRQLQNSWFFTEDDGTILGQRVTPISRVGIYVPGGKAAYPSTVLMNAVPAKVAGVEEVVMLTPPSKDGINPYVLAAAVVAGVDNVFCVGGAQAVAALAFGTRSIPKVDKIVGPGNIFVATAKKLVFGTVDIDMIAGPSEVLIINDGSGDAELVAADLLGQAEHDELASSILITTSTNMAEKVRTSLKRQLATLKRKTIASESIRKFGAIIIARDLDEAAAISDMVAPEHLELCTKSPLELLAKVKNAGAIFLGQDTPEAAGDYLAGPNHTLPTGTTARFSSPLGVEDFVKKSSIIGFTQGSIKRLGKDVERFARIEGLQAHARSMALRKKKKG